MIISVFPKKHSKMLSRRLNMKLCVRILQCAKQSLRGEKIGLARSIVYTTYFVRAGPSVWERVLCTRAQTTYPAGPSTGEILARHGWGEVVYTTNFFPFWYEYHF